MRQPERLKQEFRQLLRSFMFFVQRQTRGWDDSETYSLDHSFAKFITPRLRRFKQLTKGVPLDFVENPQGWHKALTKMIVAFEYLGGEDRWNNPEIPEYVEEGLDLFRKYYHNLWW